MVSPIKLILGLGNPGSTYANTRHNAGNWFVHVLANRFDANLKENTKLQANVGTIFIAHQKIIVATPTTYMNHSGFPARKLLDFYKLDVAELLVAHDELDLEPGIVRLKSGGGHGGNNGLRHIIEQLSGQKHFLRLRIGIGHPGSKEKVTGHVLSPPSPDDKISIEAAIEAASQHMENITAGRIETVMNELHRFDACS